MGLNFLDKVPIISSKRKCDRAERIIRFADGDHEDAMDSLNRVQETSKQYIAELFDLKTSCSTVVIPKALDTLERYQKIKRSDTSVSNDSYERFSNKSLPALRKQAISVGAIVNGGARGTAAGSALALGSMSLVSTFGAASTGTAITSLSGVAATNATMAWFGGGALSAGGAGMAGGAAVLGGIALAPLVVIGAFKYASHAEEKLTAAMEYSDEMDVIVAKINAAVDFANALNSHVTQFTGILQGLVNRLIAQTKILETLAEKNSDEVAIKPHKMQVILLVRAIKRFLEIELFDKNQQPTEKSLKLINHAIHTNESQTEDFISGLAPEEEAKLPQGAIYLEDINVGNDSPKYFWLQDEFYENKEEQISIENKTTKASSTKNEGPSVLFLAIMTVFFLWLAEVLRHEFRIELIPYLFIGVAVTLFLKMFLTGSKTKDATLGGWFLISLLWLIIDYLFFGVTLKIVKDIF